MNKNFNRILWSVGVCGVGWNMFGAYQFIGSLTATTESLVVSGLTAEQAIVMTSYPLWMTIAFGVGVGGGLLGSVLLLMKSLKAEIVFLTSLIAYIVLYIGDITEGVFAALGAPQVIILSTVVAIAAGLWWFAKAAVKRGVLA